MRRAFLIVACLHSTHGFGCADAGGLDEEEGRRGPGQAEVLRQTFDGGVGRADGRAAPAADAGADGSLDRDGSDAGGARFDVQSVPGVAIDRWTGLSWQRSLPSSYPGCAGRYRDDAGQAGDACRFLEAADYCGALALGGERGWRLPSGDELQRVAEETSHALDPEVFTGGLAERYWTTALVPGETGHAVCFDFSTGAQDLAPRERPLRVRCVR